MLRHWKLSLSHDNTFYLQHYASLELIERLNIEINFNTQWLKSYFWNLERHLLIKNFNQFPNQEWQVFYCQVLNQSIFQYKPEKIFTYTFSTVFSLNNYAFRARILHHVTPRVVSNVVGSANRAVHLPRTTVQIAGCTTRKPSLEICQTSLLIATAHIIAGSIGCKNWKDLIVYESGEAHLIPRILISILSLYWNKFYQSWFFLIATFLSTPAETYYFWKNHQSEIHQEILLNILKS